jgi:predicted metalloenzyme YecM
MRRVFLLRRYGIVPNGINWREWKMIRNLGGFYARSNEYVAAFNAFIVRNQLEGKVCADHICYKCGSRGSFERIRALFENDGWYYQTLISNRRIAVIRFAVPIRTNAGNINFLELSDQKPDGSQVDGFDHIEVYPTGMDYAQFITQLSTREKVVFKERPHHSTYDVDIGNGFIFRTTSGPLVQKIIAEQMS